MDHVSPPNTVKEERVDDVHSLTNRMSSIQTNLDQELLKKKPDMFLVVYYAKRIGVLEFQIGMMK